MLNGAMYSGNLLNLAGKRNPPVHVNNIWRKKAKKSPQYLKRAGGWLARVLYRKPDDQRQGMGAVPEATIAPVVSMVAAPESSKISAAVGGAWSQ